MQAHLAQFFPLGMADADRRWRSRAGFRVLRFLRHAFRLVAGGRRRVFCPQP
jgi:hypothetical protein